MDVISGAGTGNPSGRHEFTPCFSRVRVAQSLYFLFVFCRSLFVFFVPFPLVIVLSALLPLVDSDYFRLFFMIQNMCYRWA